jgi:hypothetical protein
VLRSPDHQIPMAEFNPRLYPMVSLSNCAMPSLVLAVVAKLICYPENSRPQMLARKLVNHNISSHSVGDHPYVGACQLTASVP